MRRNSYVCAHGARRCAAVEKLQIAKKDKLITNIFTFIFYELTTFYSFLYLCSDFLENVKINPKNSKEKWEKLK